MSSGNQAGSFSSTRDPRDPRRTTAPAETAIRPPYCAPRPPPPTQQPKPDTYPFESSAVVRFTELSGWAARGRGFGREGRGRPDPRGVGRWGRRCKSEPSQQEVQTRWAQGETGWTGSWFAAEDAELVRFLEETGENPVDVEGLGVARDALGEAAEQRDQVGLLARLRVEQLENGLAEAGQRERAETMRSTCRDWLTGESPAGSGLPATRPGRPGWSADDGAIARRIGVRAGSAARRRPVSDGVAAPRRARQASIPPPVGQSCQGRRADALHALVKEKEARPGAAPGKKNATGRHRQFSSAEHGAAAQTADASGWGRRSQARKERSPVSGSGPPRPDPDTRHHKNRWWTSPQHRDPEMALMRREQTLEWIRPVRVVDRTTDTAGKRPAAQRDRERESAHGSWQIFYSRKLSENCL